MKTKMMSMVTVAFVMCVIVSTSSAAEYFDPSPIYYDTVYVSPGNYQGCSGYDVEGLSTYTDYVLVATELSNIVEAWASWGYDPSFFSTTDNTSADQYTSCRKDDQDAGVYGISLYKDKGTVGQYEPGTDEYRATVYALVDY